MRQNFRRVPVPQQVQQRSRVKTFPSPIRGWVVNENLAVPKPAGARILENWRPTSTGVQLRGGSSRHATIGSTPVQSIMTYNAGGLLKMFAANATGIFDVTAPADPEVPPAAAVAVTSGLYSSAQMATTGGSFLIAVNGADLLQLYDGSTWAAIDDMSTPSIANVATDALSHVWTYRNRVFFVEGGTLTAWYLPVDSIGGAAADFSLAGVFQDGGSLLLGATWSLDAGDGIDDKCVFISDLGEAAIYEGGNPSDANDWRLVGRYQIGRPLGKRATMRAGGDLLVATEEGVVPISAAINKDKAALSLASVSRNIAPEWSREALARTLPWDMVKWSAKKIAVVALPADPGQVQCCFVVNLETGAWAKYTGWDTRCLGLHGGQVYFGTSDGRIMQAETGGSDDGASYECIAVGLFDHFDAIGPIKTIQMARATFLAGKSFEPQLTASVDYSVTLPAAPASVPDDVIFNEWDSGLWDQATWDAGTSPMISTRWVSIGASGFTAAWQIQVTCGVTPTPDAELVSIDMTYETGGLVV